MNAMNLTYSVHRAARLAVGVRTIAASRGLSHSAPVPSASDIDLAHGSPRAQALSSLLSHFRAPIRFAFAYGSAVFPQAGYTAATDADAPMVDLVFGVTHAAHWHSINLAQNPGHYSGLRHLGSSAVAAVQDAGAGVYYNPYVTLPCGTSVKYGVVSIDRLTSDLARWDSLYLAGRMHKPIQVLRHDSRVSLAQWANLAHALRVAFLSLPPTFATDDLYRAVASMSYRGDFRTAIPGLENPHKVTNLVARQAYYFAHIYRPLIAPGPDAEFSEIAAWNGDTVEVSAEPKTRAAMLAALPPKFLARVANAFGHVGEVDHAAAMTMATSPKLRDAIDKALVRTIARPALVQSAKGVLTAGPAKTVAYAAAKIRKGVAAKK
ncbi:Mitochondrial translocator assembly and maintenance protein 41 [Blastocladiella emersonii ATCC 22665]|nr:Mitochondrial translocator assembly and maintenance protein 41 [Blastocladiella emersonii ATCC 22665]